MVPTGRPTRERHPQPVNTLLLEDALATWIPPTVGFALLAGAIVLDALGMIADAPTALTTIFALLLLGVFMVVSPLVHAGRTAKIRPRILAGVGVAWIALYAWPFALRLHPGNPVATTALAGDTSGKALAVGPGRFDVVLDAHLPPSADRQSRRLHYAITATDGTGAPHHLEGDLGDRWQTRRLGRGGTAPVHLEHLSARYEVDNPTGDTLLLDDVAIAGVPNATLDARAYRHRVPPIAWLLTGGVLIAVGALAFDYWMDPRRTPTAAFLTATATGAVVVFCSSAVGHVGIRQVFGAVIVGALAGVPATAFVAWLARRSPWTRAITVGDRA
jgi:hypothetical protein